MKTRRLPWFLLWSLSCIALACSTPQAGPAPTPAEKARSGSLGVQKAEDGRSAVPTGPVQVVHYSPTGEAPASAFVSVVFDRPMVELGTSPETSEALLIEPRVEGRARWLGSQTLVFEPRNGFPSATAFEVRVPKGLKSLNGQELETDLVFEFKTPALAVAYTDPGMDARQQRPGRTIDVFFNQSVSPERVQAALSLRVRAPGAAARNVGFSVKRRAADDARSVRVTPREKFPIGAQVELSIAGSLRGDEGPREMGDDFSTSFSVYGPLAFAPEAVCPRAGCSPSGMSLRFTNPVKVKDALKQLRFSPEVPRHADYEADYTSEYVHIAGNFAPNTTYTARLEGNLVDAFGNAFSGKRELTFSTGSYEPSASFSGNGELLTLEQAQLVSVRMTNLASPVLHLFPIAAGDVETYASGRKNWPGQGGVVSSLPAVSGSEWQRVPVDPTPVLQAGKGVFLAAITDKQRGKDPIARTLLAVTDLAPSLKIGSDGGLVWVTSLSSAQAVSGAKVRVLDCGKTVASGSTDTSGMYRFSLNKPSDCDVFAVVEHAGDVSFTHKYAGVGPWALSENAGWGDASNKAAYVFTERGVYRPGDTMQIKGILRAHGAKGLEVLRGSVHVKVSDSQGSEIEQQKLELNGFGTFARSVRIPGSVALGPLSIEVTHGSDSFHQSVEVAEYRRAELEVDVRAAASEVVRGSKTSVRVAANYLFGAPVANQRVVWSGRRVERSSKPAGEAWENFTYTDDTRWFDEVLEPEDTTLFGGEGKLDARGELSLDVTANMKLTSGVAGLEVEATVDGLSGATASGRSLLLVTPASYLVGIKAASSLITPGQAVALDLAAVTLAGEPAAKATLDVSLERRVYSTQLKEGEGGRSEYVTTHKDEVVQTCKVQAREGLGRCELTPKEPGLHFARVRSKDAAGRAVEAALVLYAYGSGTASWGNEDGPVIQLKADRARYRLGETAKILVASPFDEAEALITVEREGVLSVEQRHLVGKAATLEIPVDSRFVPNAFVTVLLVRPVSSEAQPAEKVPFRVGGVEIRTDTEQHHLRVAVTPDAAEKKPGDALNVAFEVKDGNGKPQKAELTVFAVDEGVLSLTGYKTPDPFELFYAPRSLQVWTADARGSLARFAPEEEKGGGEGGGGGEEGGLRTNFDALAFYAAEVVTDEAGRAKVNFKLPDSLTRYRIMAVAVTQGADAGAGAAEVRTKKPLMLRPALPRAMRVGDAFEAGATVHNESAEDMQVELRAEVDGLALVGDKLQRVSVKKGAAVEVRFKMRADKAGQATLRFAATAGREADALSVTRAVSLPSPLETVSTTGSAQGTLKEGIQALKGVRKDAGGLEISMSTTALTALKAPGQALVDYPYNCTEQLASRLIGMAAMLRLGELGALEVDAGLPERIEGVLGELERHQRGDGAFGLWSRNEWGAPSALTGFLTSYALLALEEARAAKVSVGSHAIRNAQSYLTDYLRDVREQARRNENLASATFAVYALARTGQIDASYLNTLYEQRAQLDLPSQVALGHSLALADRADESRSVLELVSTNLRVTADEAHVESNLGGAYAVILASDVRATAQLVVWLLTTDAKHVLLPRLVRWLSSARELDGTWGTTQDNAWGMVALARYAESAEKETPDLRVAARLDSKTLAEVTLEGRKATHGLWVPMESLGTKGNDIELSSSGKGTLHYTLRLSYAHEALRTTPEERGFYVERSYERIDPAALARGEARGEAVSWANVGDYVRVTLQVVVPATRRFVMVEDPLPAGLEPVNLSWANESHSAGSALSEAQGPHDHSELRDTLVAFSAAELEPGIYRYRYLARASTPGTFVAPPAGAHEMYHPETYGQTAAGSYEVRAR